jgi:erythromycin esterase-like protein/predicted phosphoribosyltransferase
LVRKSLKTHKTGRKLKTMNATSTLHMFANRQDAGRQLAELLTRFSDEKNLTLLALPRGGVPVAAEIAKTFHRPFDVLIVRKLGVPGHEEVAMGAIASGGVQVLSDDMISMLRLSRAQVDAIIEKETMELERREKIYRGKRPVPAISGRTVIVVDDGIATGATMSAAIELLRHQQAARIIVAVPVAPRETIDRLREEADEVVTVLEPELFTSVGKWYKDFSQTTDEEVRALIEVGHPVKAPAPPKAAHHLTDKSVLHRVREFAQPLTGAEEDYDGLLEMIGDSSVVLLGEATHGTHEFYRQRAEITKRLIVEKGFNAIAVEADWPDAYRINRYVRGSSSDVDSVEALTGFDRFPAWMWRNADMLDFVGWLRDHNEHVYSLDHQVGFYGLDLYSLHKSMNEVISYLEKIDPTEAAKARALYGCMDRYGKDPQNYGLMVGSGVGEGCRSEVIQQLADLRAKEVEYMARDGAAAADEFFFAEQNARLVKNAEEYYRKMFRSDVSCWNLRDEHMTETLVELAAHLQTQQGSAKVVVWAHNSHLGDARATQMGKRGELNIGQLARVAFPEQCKLIGFTTYAGTVTAAGGWHLPAERKDIRPGLEGSYEHLFHQVGIPNFWLDLTQDNPAAEALRDARLERAIGVVYLPETERRSHYFEAHLTQQFDAVLHFDLTRAVEPLEKTTAWCLDEAPETFPAGL